VHVRDAGSLSDTIVLEDNRDGLVSLTFNPQGTILATVDGDPPEVLQQPVGKDTPRAEQARPVRLWDAKTGSPLRSLTVHMGSIHALVFNPEGTRLISAGADRLIRVWDTGNGRLLRTLEGHSKSIHALALGLDGRHPGACPSIPCITANDHERGRDRATESGGRDAHADSEHGRHRLLQQRSGRGVGENGHRPAHRHRSTEAYVCTSVSVSALAGSHGLASDPQDALGQPTRFECHLACVNVDPHRPGVVMWPIHLEAVKAEVIEPA